MAEKDTSQGRNVVVGIGLEGDAGVAVVPVLFPGITTEGFRWNPNRQDITGLNGSRSHHYQATAEGNIDGTGTFAFNSRKQWLQNVLYWAMGGGNANAPTLADTIKSLTMEVDKVVRVITYAGCKIGTLVLSSESNNPLMINCNDILAMSIADDVAGTATSPIRTITDGLMMHHGLTVTVDGGTITCNSHVLNLENMLEDDHFQNSQSRTAIPEGDRIIHGTIIPDWSVANAVTRQTWTKFVSGATASIAAAYTDGTNILTLTMPRCHYHEGDRAPGTDTRGTFYDDVRYQAKASAAGVADEMTAVWS